MPSHCTVSPRPGASDTRPGAWDLCWLAGLTAGVLLVHGFHPWAEDGGLYVTGAEHLLHPALFAADRAFVVAPMRYSVFAPMVAALVRSSHASLATVIFLLYLFTTALTLFAAWRLARLCFAGRTPQWVAVALLATWWTLPVAGTSLLLMDPYLTARSFSTPFTLLAIGEVVRRRRQPVAWWQEHGSSFRLAVGWTSGVRCALWLLLAALFHPLMAIYAAGFVLIAGLLRRGVGVRTYVLLLALVCTLAAAVQWAAAPDTPAETAAVISRYYWFLSQWQWYEWLGLLGPLALLAALLYVPRDRLRSPQFRVLCLGSLLLGLLAVLVSVFFAREGFAAHAVARLQPLRAFLPIYALLPLLLGGWLAESLLAVSSSWKDGRRPGWVGMSLAGALLLLTGSMFGVQRATFPGSTHIEWPGRANPNRWVQAFLWVRANTPVDALFALDARYVNTEGEDAQSFRAIAQRSTIPDYSKDGGEAANFPQLAPAWQRSSQATANLSQSSDAERRSRLQNLGVGWLILHSTAETASPCPYDNGTVKVCRFSAPSSQGNQRVLALTSGP